MSPRARLHFWFTCFTIVILPVVIAGCRNSKDTGQDSSENIVEVTRVVEIIITATPIPTSTPPTVTTFTETVKTGQPDTQIDADIVLLPTPTPDRTEILERIQIQVPNGWHRYNMLDGDASFWHPPNWSKKDEDLGLIQFEHPDGDVLVALMPNDDLINGDFKTRVNELKKLHLLMTMDDFDIVFDKEGQYETLYNPVYVTALNTKMGTTIGSVTSYATDGENALIIVMSDHDDYASDQDIATMGILVQSSIFDQEASVELVPLEQAAIADSIEKEFSNTKPYVAQIVNLREGPGTIYSVVGSLNPATDFNIVARNEAGDWFQIMTDSQQTAWVAASLINGEIDADGIGIADNIPAPPVVSQADTNTSAQQESNIEQSLSSWQDDIQLGVPHSCGHFEYKVYDLRRVKSVWQYSREYVAQGEFLLVFVEVKNVSGGTSYLGQMHPRVATVGPDGELSILTGSSKGSSYARWMYQSGSFYEDVNPGGVIGLVEAYDLPTDKELVLAFGLGDCTDDLLSLGLWSNVQRGHAK